MRSEESDWVVVPMLSNGNFMMRTVIERRSSRPTRSFAISTVDARWPMPGDGMNTSCALLILIGLFCFLKPEVTVPNLIKLGTGLVKNVGSANNAQVQGMEMKEALKCAMEKTEQTLNLLKEIDIRKH
ncbi:hypothetical protein LOK49_LG06G02100 [Camellia lanceoleosa]|uniref:Uncharacterized protein n=1 Tax=Camellia lanceoleosa TaxID=1840588 RepID=A0ACC0HCE5_9ERIC|nr:hypothetical protein LOK49_LG06G02100 [Camellia lanceoleosa]